MAIGYKMSFMPVMVLLRNICFFKNKICNFHAAKAGDLEMKGVCHVKPSVFESLFVLLSASLALASWYLEF